MYQNQIGTFFPIGGEKVIVSSEDIKHIKYFDAPGMKLMGFKPRSRIKDYHNVRASYFINADDARVTNSSQVMDALIKTLVAQDKVAIVRFIPREASVVRFCALIP